jgi:hypothetical protein
VRNESITSLRQGIVDAPLKNHLGGVLLKIVCHLSKIAETLTAKRKITNVEFIHSLACSYCGVTASLTKLQQLPAAKTRADTEEAKRQFNYSASAVLGLSTILLCSNSSNRLN